MTAIDLIDTTEMYLKTIYEMEEDSVTPLRARIVERLGHSGPTVSQTIARMERDDLVKVREDRRLELTEKGRAVAFEVMRKHRLAECLLVDVVGLDWRDAHEEACRWEHVMSVAVEDRLRALLGDPGFDPYGNPIPGNSEIDSEEVSVEFLPPASEETSSEFERVRLVRIGEPIQAERNLIAMFADEQILPGQPIGVRRFDDHFEICHLTVEKEQGATSMCGKIISLPSLFASHLFVKELRL